MYVQPKGVRQSRSSKMEQLTATVIGASVAGLLAAKVLSEHVARVIVVERDPLPTEPKCRKGTAQAPHVHLLLKRGLGEFEVLCPGFTTRILQHGAHKTNATQDWYALFPRGLLIRYQSDLDTICASRALMEHCLRKLVLSADNIECRDYSTVVRSELHTHRRPRIHVRPDNGANTYGLEADILVDAGGRNSRNHVWLEDNGFGTVPRSITRPYLGYSTRRFRNILLPEGYQALLSMHSDPENPTGGVIMPIEDGGYIVTLWGFCKRYPPREDDAFMEFAKCLRSPLIYLALKQAYPLTPVKTFRKNENAFRHYERCRTWPQGFVVTGDAVCSFNPVYGQGMTSAAIAGHALGRQLRTDPRTPGWARRTQQRIAKIYRTPWLTASIEDLRWPDTEGMQSSIAVRGVHRFLDRINRAATRDKTVSHAYLNVLHMCARPAALFGPLVLARVLLHGGEPAELW